MPRPPLHRLHAAAPLSSRPALLAGGDGWARLWASAWLLALCYAFFMAGVHELLGDAYTTTAFLPLVYGSALSGWNLDLAPSGYSFFQCFPSWSGVRLIRHALFGARGRFVGMHVGILVGEAAFGLLAYYAVALALKPALGRLLRARAFGGKPAPDLVPAPPARGEEASPAAAKAASTSTSPQAVALTVDSVTSEESAGGAASREPQALERGATPAASAPAPAAATAV